MGSTNTTQRRLPLRTRIADFAVRGFRVWAPLAAFGVALGAVLGALPFFVLIRGGLVLDRWIDWNAWLSLLFAAAGAAALISLYVFRLWRWVAGTGRYVFISTRLVAPAVLACCLVGLFYLASANAKDPAVRDTYSSLHPVLRLAVASWCLLDEDLVLTDIHRTPAAYRRMSLPVASQSLHYVQPDGFVHAIDVRTRGHAASRNLLTQAWFLALGFDTIRHTGSADHLHISLPRVGRG